MRHFAAILALGLVLSFATARADTAAQPAVPSTQPACDVYLTPFNALGNDNSLDWAGKAVSQNLLTDLARSRFHALESDQIIPTTADALAAAKSAGARYLITGTYQSLELQVRFNGQIIEVKSNNVVGGISATGAPRDLFALEDALSAQAIAQLTQIAPTVANNQPHAPPPPALQPPALVQVVQPPAVAQAAFVPGYQGSALQQYVDSDRTPSEDYAQQVQNAQDRENFSTSNYDLGLGYGGFYPLLGGFGGGYGYGFGFVYVTPGYGYRHGDRGDRGDHGDHGFGHNH